MPWCPDGLKNQLSEKLDHYMRAQWCMCSNANQAAPMLCIPKKNGTLHTIVDYHQWNANMVKDVTAFPDQDHIRTDVAHHKYWSKVDMSDAYEQIRNELLDVWKSAFVNISRTFISNVIVQGDCNSPATFQRVMTMIFQDIIRIYVHVYMDNIFIFSDTPKEQECHIQEVFSKETLSVSQNWEMRIICGQSQLPGTPGGQLRHTHWQERNVQDLWMVYTLQLQWHPEIPWTHPVCSC